MIVTIFDFPIIKAWLTYGFKIVQRTSWPCGWGTAADGVIDVGVPTAACPDRFVHKRYNLLLEVGTCSLLECHDMNGLCLVVINKRTNVISLGFDCDNRRPIGDGCVWTQHSKRVGKLRYSNSHISHKRLCPLFLQVATSSADDGVPRDVRCVEAGCADDDFSLMASPVLAYTS